MALYDKRQPETIKSMFDHIACRYDLTNGLLSFQLHRHWNQQLIKKLIDKDQAGLCLADLCCGTGDIAFRWLRKAKGPQYAKLVDFSVEMLQCAKSKALKLKIAPHHKIEYITADVHNMPLDSFAIDFATMAYGVRNVLNPFKCFQEVHRILKPGGKFGILELTRPSNPLLKMGHKLYLQKALPLIGKLFTTNKEAYKYLSQSIDNFIRPQELKGLLKEAGFKEINIIPICCGIATIIIAKKPK